MTILKPVRLFNDIIISKLSEGQIKKQKDSSTVFLIQHRLKCALAYHILGIYHSHGFFVRASVYTKSKNQVLYDLLTSIKPNNKKLCRTTETGFTCTNVPIVLSVIAHLLQEKVLVMDQKWIEIQKGIKPPPDIKAYRKSYKPLFQFVGDERMLSLDKVFNVLVFGMKNPTCRLEFRLVKEEKVIQLPDETHQSINDVIGDNSLSFYVKLLENSYKPMDEDNVDGLKNESSFLSNAIVTKLQLGATSQENHIETLKRFQRDLLSQATLVGANIEMILKSNDTNIEEGDESSTEEADKDPATIDSKYLKGGGVKMTGYRKVQKLPYPEATFAPIVENLQTKLQAMMLRLKNLAFDSGSFVSHQELWDSFLEIGKKTDNFKEKVTASTKLKPVAEETLPSLEGMSDDQLASMFEVEKGSQDNLAEKFKTFLDGLNKEDAEEANTQVPIVEEMTDEALEAWLKTKGEKFAERLRLILSPKTDNKKEADRDEDAISDVAPETPPPKNKKEKRTPKSSAATRKLLDDQHESSDDNSDDAPISQLLKKPIPKKGRAKKPEASKEDERGDDSSEKPRRKRRKVTTPETPSRTSPERVARNTPAEKFKP
jgi:hypothetical protein